MSDGSIVSLVHDKGEQTDWKSFSLALGPAELHTPRISYDRSAGIDWKSVATLRLVFEFAAGYMHNDAWAMEWDDLVTWDVPKRTSATTLAVPSDVTPVDKGNQYTFSDVNEVRNSSDIGTANVTLNLDPPDFELGIDLTFSFAAARSLKKSQTGVASLTKGYLWNTISAQLLPSDTTVWSCLDKYIQVSDKPPANPKLQGFQVEPHGTYSATPSAASFGAASAWFDVDVVDLTTNELVAGDTIDAAIAALLYATNVPGDIYQRGLNACSIDPGGVPHG